MKLERRLPLFYLCTLSSSFTKQIESLHRQHGQVRKASLGLLSIQRHTSHRRHRVPSRIIQTKPTKAIDPHSLRCFSLVLWLRATDNLLLYNGFICRCQQSTSIPVQSHKNLLQHTRQSQQVLLISIFDLLDPALWKFQRIVENQVPVTTIDKNHMSPDPKQKRCRKFSIRSQIPLRKYTWDMKIIWFCPCYQ